MNLTSLGQIALTAIISAGGIGGLLVLVVKLCTGMITERMNEKFKSSLSKELEKYKSELTKKEYVSKTRFEAEFQLYRDLSGAFFDLVQRVNAIIPYGYYTVPADEAEKKAQEEKNYIEASSALINAQNLLLKNSPFITERLFNLYEELFNLCRIQVSIIQERYNVGNYCENKGIPKTEDRKRTNLINENFQKLQKELREYLAKLDVAE